MKKLLVGGLAATTLGLTTLGAGAAFAHGGVITGDFASSFAERFGLNQNEVQDFMDEQHQQHMTERTQESEAYLQSKVDDGAITAEQKDALLAKQQEMHTFREELRNQNLSRDEMRNQIQANRDEFEQWATEQGINMSILRPQMEGGMHGRHGGGPRHQQEAN